MANGHKRLDTVGAQTIKNAIVESKASLVGFILHARGEDARPGDSHAKRLEAHLGHKRDIVLISVIEVDSVMVGIILVRIERRINQARRIDIAAGNHIGHRDTLAFDIPSALKLVGGSGATPEEALRKSGGYGHGIFLSVDLGDVPPPQELKQHEARREQGGHGDNRKKR